MFEEQHEVFCAIWNLGVIMYFLILGELPFDGDSIYQIASQMEEQGLVFKDRHQISDIAIDLIEKMLD